ncbi:MAG: hypothetical protein VW498_02135 [Candidatus Thalassarchaeaceae archaeon]
MIKTYLEQLQEIAEQTGWDLEEACVDAGVAKTTYWRWTHNKITPRLAKAQQVAEYMLSYAR